MSVNVANNAMPPQRPERAASAAPAIKDILNAIIDETSRGWVYRNFGLLVAWIIAALAAVIALALPDRYTARAQIYVNTDTLLRPLLKGLTVDSNADQQVSVLQKTLLTDVNLSKVLLQGDEDLKVASRADLAGAIAGLRSQIRIDGIGNQLFTISFDGSAPERARQIVQSLLTIFIETNLGMTRTDMQTARDFLDQQIAANQAQLAAATQKLTEFRAQHVNVLGETDISSRLAAARVAYQDATLELQGAEEARKTLKTRLASTDPFVSADTPPAQIVVGDQLIVSSIDRINTLRAQLRELRLRYTEDHPDVIALREELASLVRQYSADETKPSSPNQKPAHPAASTAPAGSSATDAASGSGAAAPHTTPNPQYAEIKAQLLKAELSVLDAEQKVAKAQATLSSLEAQGKIAPPIEAELAQLTQAYDTAKKNYEDLLPRRESARMSQAVDTTVDAVQFRIVEPPTLPAKPSGPNRGIILFLGTIAALGGGCFAAFARGIYTGAVVSARDLSTAFGLPVIASIASPVQRQPRLSLQIATVAVGMTGIIVAMVAISYAMPSFEHYRFKAYSLVSQMLS